MKGSLSHVYKVVSCTDQNNNYKVINVESKNTTTCWRTSKPCSQASFEIKFAPIKLHHIDIINAFSPQVEVHAYNKDVQDRIIDEYTVIPRSTFFKYTEVLEGQMTTKTKKFDLYDKGFIPDIQFSYMRVTVYNPQHEDKAIYLGLNSFILFCKTGNDSGQKTRPDLAFLEQKNREVEEQLKRAVGFDRLEASTRGSQISTAASPSTDRRLSMFSFRNPQDSKELFGGTTSFSAQRNRSSGIGLESVVPGLKRTWDKRNQENMNGDKGFYDSMTGGEKRIRPNHMGNDRPRSNLGRPLLRKKNDYSGDDDLGSDDDLQRAIRESEEMYKKDKARLNQLKDYEEELDRREMSGLRKINETDERTQDNEEFQRALQASKEAYLQENDGPKADLIGLAVESQQDECNGKTYIDMLERIAEEEEGEIGEIPEDEVEVKGQEEEEDSMLSYNLEMDDLEKEEKTDEVLTEVLEDSMAKLWSTEDDENEVKHKNNNHGDMEIEERKETARRFGGGIEEEIQPTIKLTFESDDVVFPRARNVQTWGFKDTDNMIPLGEKDFYNRYLAFETKVRNEAERKKNRGNNVQVVTSYGDILKDVVFCLAGFEGDEKKSLKDLGISMGARFLDDIYVNLTTHLVTSDETMTKKYQRAKKMKEIAIVSTRWLVECYGQKKRLPEKDFIVDLGDYVYDKDEDLFE